MPENRTYLPRRKLLGRYGVTEMTLWRWERDPLLGFPPPVVINSKKFFDVDELEAWERKRRARPVRIVAEQAAEQPAK